MRVYAILARMNYWPLLGVAVVVAGFALRMNPALVVVVAAIVSGMLSGLSIPDLLALLGAKFIDSRNLLILVLTLPTIGLLEHAGLREHAANWIARMRRFTFARLLIGYLAVRQILSMFGLTGIAGHAQTVRPLLAPMAEAAAEKIDADIDLDERVPPDMVVIAADPLLASTALAMSAVVTKPGTICA